MTGRLQEQHGDHGAVNGAKFLSRQRRRWALWSAPLLLLAASGAQAAPTVTATTSFQPADGSARDYMDVAGVWNGSAEVSASTGDLVSLAIANAASPDEAAEALSLSLSLPSGITYLNDSASAQLSGAGCAATPALDDGVAGHQTGGSLNIVIGAGSYDLPADCSLTLSLQLRAESGVNPGANTLVYDYRYSAASVPVDPADVQQSFNVNPGAALLEVQPLMQTKAVSASANWTVSLTNTGTGALFDVQIDESQLNPGTSLQLTSISQSAPASPSAVASKQGAGSAVSDTLTLAYLAPGDSFTLAVAATVTGCASIENTVSASHRTSALPDSVTAQITLDLQQPLIDYAAPTGALRYDAAQNFSLNVNSTGLGDTFGLVLDSNLESLGVAVSVSSPDWSYNPASGEFSYTGGATPGLLTNGASSSIDFSLQSQDVCAAPGGGLVTWESRYQNACSNPFTTPTRFASIGGPSNTPALGLLKSRDGGDALGRLDLGEAAGYDITLSAQNGSLIASNPLLVSDVLPSNIENISVSVPVGSFDCGGDAQCDPGETLSWQLDPADLAGGARTLQLDFNASSDTCQGGQAINNTASVDGVLSSVSSASAPAGCPIAGASSSAQFLIGNGPVSDANIDYDVAAPATGSAFETGDQNADCVATVGEGECIPFSASYSFGAGYLGQWSGSSYADDFGGAAQMVYVPGTAEASVNGGAFQSIPAGSISGGTGSLSIDLGFLLGAPFSLSDAIASTQLQIRYRATAPDAALAGAETRSLTAHSTLTIINGSGSGACDVAGNATFVQPVRVDIARAAASVAVSGMPATIDVCEVFPVSLQLRNNGNGTLEHAADILSQLQTGGDYAFDSLAGTPYAGQFTGAIDADLGAIGGPSFEFDIGSDDSHDEALDSGGDISLLVQRRAQTQSGFGAAATTALGATVSYDDNQTVVDLPLADRAFNVSGSASPTLVRAGDLLLTTSPQTITVSGSTANWVIYVTNTGNGAAYNTLLSNDLPADLAVDQAATDAANASTCNITPRAVALTSAGADPMQWNLGTLAPGETCAISVATTVQALDCAIPAASNRIETRWGCGGVDHQAPDGGLSFAADPRKDNSPDFLFLDGKMELAHVSLAPNESYCVLCDITGEVVLRLRNTGGSHIFNLAVSEDIGTGSGLSYVAGSAEVAINGGSFVAAPDPAVAVGVLTWQHSQGGVLGQALSDLHPLAEAGGAGVASAAQEVLIRFRVATDETPASSAPSISASASGTRACGGSVINASGSVFSLPVRKPDIRVTKRGINRTLTPVGGSYSNRVVADPGDSVEWEIVIANNGEAPAENVLLTDVFAATGNTAGLLNGPGHSNTALTSNVAIGLPDIAAAGSVTYTITETLGSSCVNASNVADVTWGCDALAPHIDSPSDNDDTARLVTRPVFNSNSGISQSFTALPGGRLAVTISFTNSGSTATLTQLANDLPYDYVLDGSFQSGSHNASVGGTSSASVSGVNLADPNQPVFSLGGSVANGQIFSLTFHARPGSGDSGADPFVNPELAGADDPVLPSGQNNRVTLDFDLVAACALSDQLVHDAAMEPATPDVDLAVSPASAALADGQSATFTFTLSNNGDAGSSGDNLAFALLTDATTGWSFNSLSAGGSACASASACSGAEIGSLAAGASIDLVLNATANDVPGGTLKLIGQLSGGVDDSAGNPTGINHSFDQAQPRVVGFSYSKTLDSSSEAASSGSTALIGEELTWRLRARWFGLDFAGGQRVGGIGADPLRLVESLPANLGYVSHSFDSGGIHNLPGGAVTVSAPAPVASGNLQFDLPDIVSAASNGFDALLVTRVLNNAATQAAPIPAGLPQTATLDAAFAVDDGGPAAQNFNRQLSASATVHRPQLGLSAAVRAMPAGSFAASAQGDAGDRFQFRLTLSNTGSAPIFNLDLLDTQQSDKLDIDVSAGTHGADSDSNNVVESNGGSIGSTTLGPLTVDTLQFTESDPLLAVGSPARSLAQLDPGQSLVLLYETTAAATAVPQDLLQNSALLLGSSLSGALGAQTANGDVDGELVLSATAQAGVNVTAATLSKTIAASSEAASSGSDVLIGEQLRFRLLARLPEGSTPAYVIRDDLPEGLLLLQTPAPQLGASVSCANTPANIAPAALPASGAPLALSWSFGDCTVVAGGDADRSITVEYLVQLRNIAANDDGASLLNSASYDFTGYPGGAAAVQSLTVQEAQLTVAQVAVAPLPNPLQAGSEFDYRVTLSNLSGDVTGYDLLLRSTLPAGLSYVANSSVLESPSATLTSLGGPDVFGQQLSWGRSQGSPQDLDLAAGESAVFRYRVRVASSAEPRQLFNSPIALDWSSLDDDHVPLLALGSSGDADGERSGGLQAGSGANDLLASDTDTNASVSDGLALISKTASGDSVAGDGFRVGDPVTYTLQLNLPPGSADGLRVVDTLPAGMAFVDVLAINGDSAAPFTGSGDFSFDVLGDGAVDLPTAGQSGALTFDFGRLQHAPGADPDTLSLSYRARLLDDVAFAAASARIDNISNSATLHYLDAADVPRSSGPQSDAVSLRQPALSLSKTLLSTATVGADDSVSLRLEVSNSGQAPAYNALISEALDAELRGAAAVIDSVTLAGVDVSGSYGSFSDLGASLSWQLADGFPIQPGAANRLVIDYRLQVVGDVGASQSFGSQARVDAYHSRESAQTPRRQYVATPLQSVALSTPAPAGMSQQVSVNGGAWATSGSAQIGDSLRYRLLAPASPANVAAFKALLSDLIPAGLRVTGIATNLAALQVIDAGVTQTPAAPANGNSLSLLFNRIPAGQQVEVIVSTVVEDQPTTTAASSLLNDSAQWQFADTAAAALNPVIAASAVSVAIDEPQLSIDKVLQAQSAPSLQAGETLDYRITLSNAADADGTAYDLIIDDSSDPDLILIGVADDPGEAGDDNPGDPDGLSLPASSPGGAYRWSLPAGVSLAPGEQYSFIATFRLDADVTPFQQLSASVSASASSTVGANADERDYNASDATPVLVSIGDASVSKSLASAQTRFGIGETVSYRISFDLVQGAVDGLRLIDALPAGLTYSGATFSYRDVGAAGGGAVSVDQSGALPGSHGPLDLQFDFGDLQSSGASPQVQITLSARLRDLPANSLGSVLQNGARALFDHPNGSGTVSLNATAVDISVAEPQLHLALDGPTQIALGSPATFNARLSNAGDSAGYQPQLQFQLPVGLRGTDPGTLPISAAISGGRSLALGAGSDFTPSYDAASGVFSLSLGSARAYLAPGEQLDLGFQAALDDDASDGAAYQLLGTVTGYYSGDNSAPGAPDLRLYSVVLGSGTLGTANGDPGDDASDDAGGSASAPVLRAIKQVDNLSSGGSGRLADPGDRLRYRISLSNSGSAAATVSLLDDLHTAFVAGSLDNIAVPAGADASASSASGGAHGSGLLDVRNISLAAGGSAQISFEARLRATQPNGTTIANQARLSAPGFSAARLSDSGAAADDNPAETGNDGGDASDDDPTLTQVGSAPILSLSKSDSDDNGAPLRSGETLSYTITLRNSGNEHAVNARLSDAIPANTRYVAGSIRLNGQPLADPQPGVSPLSAGMPVNSSDTALAGRISAPDGVAEISFQVRVDEGLSPGTLLVNQAFVDAEGEGGDSLPSLPSDDPDTPESGDPTRTLVGEGALLELDKQVLDVNAGSLQPGDVLRYSLRLSNLGNRAASEVLIRDPLPAELTLLPGSLRWDADGSGPAAAVALDESDADGDAASLQSGELRFDAGSLAAAGEAQLSFEATVNAVPAGTLISNQARVAASGLPDEPSDVDGHDGNGDQPTEIVTGNQPLLRAVETVADLDGGLASPGDALEYRITLSNFGSADALGVQLANALPPVHSQYIAASTRLDGAALADIAGSSPLIGGLSLGTLAAGESISARFRVQIDANAPDGAQLVNQASFSASNANSGLSDSDLDDGIEQGNRSGDPNDDDPVVVAVGAAPGVASIRGEVWQDNDHDRQRDPGEALQAGWQVELLNGGVLLDSSVSDASGGYAFNGLRPGGGYEIRFRHPQSGAVYSRPVSPTAGADTSGGTIANLTLGSGARLVDQSLPLDPSGVLYNAITRAPLAGVPVRLSGPPGFDPQQHLLPDQQGQRSGPNGEYQFFLIGSFPAGEYLLEVAPPAGYLPFPPSMLPAESGSLDATSCAIDPTPGSPCLVSAFNRAPQQGEPTRWYRRLALAAGDQDVVNNHIPLDPILEGALSLRKTTPLVNVSRGQLVPYRIAALNNVSASLPDLRVRDQIPPGFKYLRGSATLDGVKTEPQVSGRHLDWGPLSFAAGEEKTFRLLLVVGAGVEEGEYLNQAWAESIPAAATVSNLAAASVRVVPDPLFDCSDVVGKVFDDRNANGYQNAGEPGLPGVRLATVRGLLVTTDQHGRYHISCAEIPNPQRGSNFILKLDERTLPSGYRVTTENPRVVRLGRGLLNKLNFGASIHRVIRIDLSDAAFVAGGRAPLDGYREQLESVLELLAERPSTLRLAYWLGSEAERPLAQRRIDALGDWFSQRWRVLGDRYRLALESEIYLRPGGDQPVRGGQ